MASRPVWLPASSAPRSSVWPLNPLPIQRSFGLHPLCHHMGGPSHCPTIYHTATLSVVLGPLPTIHLRVTKSCVAYSIISTPPCGSSGCSGSSPYESSCSSSNTLCLPACWRSWILH